MGLDMYLYRAPRVGDITANQIVVLDSYFDWLRSKAEGDKYANCSFEQWCGHSEDEIEEIGEDAISMLKDAVHTRYYVWDTDKEYPNTSIYDEVAYWRKANQVHKWFVDHVQDGVDDCGNYGVTQEQLEDLLAACVTIKVNTHLKKAKIQNGITVKDGKPVPIMEDGKVIANPEIAQRLLPTTGGFFFGSEEYDQYYMDDIDETIKQLTDILHNTDFEKEIVFYHSSW